jgi:hypothetical protein
MNADELEKFKRLLTAYDQELGRGSSLLRTGWAS